MNRRTETLSTASDLVNGPRAEAYGPPEVNFARIARGWEVIFGIDVQPHQVALAMDWLKTCRLLQDPTAQDGWVDKAGYAACGSEVARG